MSVFVHAQCIKTVHAGGGQKMSKFCLLYFCPLRIPKIISPSISTVHSRKFKFSEFLLDDKNATYLSS